MSTDEEADQPGLSQDGERIGYGHPPKRTQFQKGRSPNPRGRPKGAHGRAKILREVAFETHAVVENGKSLRRTTVELVLLLLRNHAAATNVRAARAYEAHLERYGVQEAIDPAGYLVVPEVVAPALGERSGVLGALSLAESA